MTVDSCDMDSNNPCDQECGCKGARWCSLCEHTPRVQALDRRETSSFDEIQDFTPYIFCHQCNVGHSILQKLYLDQAELMTLASYCPKLSHAHANVYVSEYPTSSSSSTTDDLVDLDTLILIPDFVTSGEEAALVKLFDELGWSLSQSGRRKQEWGPKVNFNKRKFRGIDSFTGMPSFAFDILDKMRTHNPSAFSDYHPFEVANLEYDPSRRSTIEFHKDDIWVWGKRLISINLLSGSIMTLRHVEQKQVLYVAMPRYSLLCMTGGPIRYTWEHSVLPEHISERRIALTMREAAPNFLPGGTQYETVGKKLLEKAGIMVNVGGWRNPTE